MKTTDMTIALDDTLVATLTPLLAVATGLEDEPGFGLILDDVPYFVAARTHKVTRLTWTHFPSLWKARPCPDAPLASLLDGEGGVAMNVYLAARYTRHPAMQQVAHALQALGHTVTSRWIWGAHQTLDSTLLQPEIRSEAQGCAQEDLEDLEAAECLIGFSDALRQPSRGGKSVEFGIALALGKRLCVVGGLEHVFHTLPQVEHYATLEALLRALAKEIK